MPGGAGHFSEAAEGEECLSILQIFLDKFYKTPGVPGGLHHFSEVVEALEDLSSL